MLKLTPFLIVALTCVSQSLQAQNSTEKNRVVPNAIAAKIGTAVAWESDFETASKKARREAKPIFWYVPRLANTFMDRKKEIDRYMRAGPFSNLAIIASLDQHYIPLMAVPDMALAAKYDLQPFRFVEPGFLIISSNGVVETKLDRITTMNPNWLRTFLLEPQRPESSPALAIARNRFAEGNYDACLEAVEAVEQNVSRDDEVELQLVSAMAMFRRNQHDDALKKFAAIGNAWPDHPLGWKAAAEAQRIGPFVRGFEVFREIPAAAFNAGRQTAGSAAPPGTYGEAELWRRGVEFLLSMQNDRGCFDDSDYDFGGSDSLSNVHAAITAIVAMALVEASDRPELKDLRPPMVAAIEKAARYVTEGAELNFEDRDELLWALLYRSRLLNQLEARWKNVGLKQIEANLLPLVRLQSESGSWYHEYSNPFVTASALCVFKEAEALGANVDASAIEAGLVALNRSRFSNGGWTYKSPVGRSAANTLAGPDRMIGSAGRAPLCESALMMWEQSNQESLVRALNSAFELHDNMDVARKYDNHTASYSYGGFFYWFCMESRTASILRVDRADVRVAMANKQRDIVLSVPEIDGCFVDSHEIGRCYGTAMALLCLSGCEKAKAKAKE